MRIKDEKGQIHSFSGRTLGETSIVVFAKHSDQVKLRRLLSENNTLKFSVSYGYTWSGSMSSSATFTYVGDCEKFKVAADRILGDDFKNYINSGY
jgi:hypothetical protein